MGEPPDQQAFRNQVLGPNPVTFEIGTQAASPQKIAGAAVKAGMNPLSFLKQGTTGANTPINTFEAGLARNMDPHAPREDWLRAAEDLRKARETSPRGLESYAGWLHQRVLKNEATPPEVSWLYSFIPGYRPDMSHGELLATIRGAGAYGTGYGGQQGKICSNVINAFCFVFVTCSYCVIFRINC